MKYINRDLKGTFGYIRKQLIFEIVKTVILFAMALGIFFIGYYTLHTKKSLWSVLAVLALLPACRSLVGVIMLARFKSLSAEAHDKYSDACGDIPVIYENILTTRDHTFYLPVICCSAGNVIAFLPGKSSNTGVLKEHLDTVLSSAGHKAAVKIFEDEDAFLKRAVQLRDKNSGADVAGSSVLDTIRAVSV